MSDQIIRMDSDDKYVHTYEESYRGPITIGAAVGGMICCGPFSLLLLLFKFDKRKKTIIT